jgi:hypothetical protein
MKVEQFATVIPLLPFNTQTMIIRKQPDLHGIGVCDKIKSYADEHHKECVIIDMAYQDELFLHELRELINYRQGREFVCVFDFTSGCNSQLKEHLMPLLIHRKHNGFEIPWTVKVVIYDNITEETEFTLNKFDMCMLDKCLCYKLEE